MPTLLPRGKNETKNTRKLASRYQLLHRGDLVRLLVRPQEAPAAFKAGNSYRVTESAADKRRYDPNGAYCVTLVAGAGERLELDSILVCLEAKNDDLDDWW